MAKRKRLPTPKRPKKQQPKKARPSDSLADSKLNLTHEAQVETLSSARKFECPICLEFEELLENRESLECGHTFHFYCINKWFVVSKKTECPLCRFVSDWAG